MRSQATVRNPPDQNGVKTVSRRILSARQQIFHVSFCLLSIPTLAGVFSPGKHATILVAFVLSRKKEALVFKQIS